MERKSLPERIAAEMRISNVVALLGPRQSGKTTLARRYTEISGLPFDGELNYFDLEDPAHVERLRNPKLAMESLSGLVVEWFDTCRFSQHGYQRFPILPPSR